MEEGNGVWRKNRINFIMELLGEDRVSKGECFLLCEVGLLHFDTRIIIILVQDPE